MTCIIVDDELAARTIVSHLCSDVGGVTVLAEFDNAIDAIKYLNQYQVDLIFLDIHMPGFTGMDFVQTLKNPPKIVLTTSDTEFAIAAYEYAFIVDYLVKPITKERFEKCMAKVAASTFQGPGDGDKPSTSGNEVGSDLYINIDRRLIKLHFQDILVIEAQGDYILIKTTKKNYKVHTTLKKINEKLPNGIFLQIHRSYIINFTKIIDIEDNSVLIEKNVIPISRSNRPELMTRLNLL